MFLRSMPQLLGATNVVPSSLIVFTIMMEDTRSYGTSGATGATRSNITENEIFTGLYFQHTVDLAILLCFIWIEI